MPLIPVRAMSTKVNASELDFVQIDNALVTLAIEALAKARRLGLKVVTAESCTAGLIATVLTEAPGAAEHFDGGFIAYTPEHKCRVLRVDADLIEAYGTVSAEVAT